MSDFLPRGQVTGIGSLPHRDPQDAINFVAKYSPSIPFWPQLPQRSADEMMIPQMLSPLRDVLQRHSAARYDIPSDKLSEFRRCLRECDARLDENSASGFYAFERACMSNVFAQASVLKGQITGPVTLAHCLFFENRPIAELPAIYSDFTDYLCRLGTWQVDRLRRFGKPVLMFIDEPALSLSSRAPQLLDCLRKVIEVLRTAGAYVGIHCCATDLPDLICQVKPDVISFDAYQGVEAFLSNVEVQRFVGQGGWLAFGIVPTLNDLSPFDPAQALARLTSAAGEAYHLPQLMSRSLVTATCGLGLLNIDIGEASFKKCHELTSLIQKAMQLANHE